MKNIPEGFKLVPVEPTDDMIVSFAEAWYSKRQTIDDPDMADAYRDMLIAAPTPPQPIYDEAVNAAVLGAQNLNAAMATIDILRAQLAERDALLTDLGVEPDGVSDVYQRLLLNAERYEYLREHMAVENFPSEHPDWSQPSEYESRRIDELCDSAMSRAKAGEDD